MRDRITHIRQTICKNCPHQCPDYLEGRIDHADPNASCSVQWSSQWHVYYGEGGAERPPNPIFTLKPATWEELHRRAIQHDGSDDSAWLLNDFTPRIPQIHCNCMRDWLRLLQFNPPRFTDYFAWSVHVHNAVNQRIEREKGLSRPILSISEAFERWRPIG